MAHSGPAPPGAQWPLNPGVSRRATPGAGRTAHPFFWPKGNHSLAWDHLERSVNGVVDFRGKSLSWWERRVVFRGSVEANLGSNGTPRATKGMAMESTVEDKCIRIDEAAGAPGEVLKRVYRSLAQSCHFMQHWREISCTYKEGILTLRGTVPSFYLKQVLQTMLMDVPGVRRVDNRVDVISSAGLSSVRRS